MTIDTNKLIKSPEVTYDYDKKNESLRITVELPGVEPGQYNLKMAACGFCISADTPSINYRGGYTFFHEVDFESAEVKFKNGTLSITAPFFEPLCGKQVPLDIDIDW